MASSIGEGEQAGNLSIQVDRLLLDTGGTIEAETAAATEGNIAINAADLQLRRGARISGNATGVATGGNISIVADTVVGLENSDITANAQTGNGGQVTIDATGILGLTFRERLTPRSDITATSDLGFQASGVVELLSPDIQIDSALAEVPAGLADGDSIAIEQCRPQDRGRGSRLTVSMRQGMRSVPDSMLQSSFPAIAPQSLSADPLTLDLTSRASRSRYSPEIYEANHFAMAESGLILAQAAVPLRTTVERPLCSR